MAKAKKAVPEGYTTATPMLTIDDSARKAIDWYKKALGAEELACALGPDGKIMHAEIRIGNSRIMMHDAMMGAKGAKALGGSPTSLYLFVEDCDTLWKRALGAGAKPSMPLDDQFWGDRCGSLVDPFGFSWWIGTRKEDLTTEEMQERQEQFFAKASKPAR